MFFSKTWLFILIPLHILTFYQTSIVYYLSNMSTFLFTKSEHIIFTVNELKEYTTIENGLYLAILGSVFDVTEGHKHYAPGAAYHHFTGRDASASYISGEFENDRLTDDVSSLSPQQIKSLNEWLQFYNKNYVYKGRLEGRFYDKYGSPTQELQEVQNKLKLAEDDNLKQANRKRMFPPCNVEWDTNKGTTLWCSNKSGGINRDWDGVPRMYYESPHSEQYRCACIKLNSVEYKDMKGILREYKDCPTNSAKCIIKNH